MSNSNTSGTDKNQSDTIKNRVSNNNMDKFKLHLVDESYDESEDPDFTIGNFTSATIDVDLDDDQLTESDSENDDEDYDNTDDDNLDDIGDNEEIEGEKVMSTLEDSDTDIDSSIATNEKQKSSIVTSESKESINSFDDKSLQNELPIHKKFYSLIHKHEIPRKLFHVSIGFITLYLHCNGYKTNQTWQPVSIAVSCIFLLDLIRFNWPYFNHLYCLTVGFLMREKEVNSINGVIWFQLGSVLTFMFQKQDVSIMSVLLLSWSDTAASTIGRKYGYLSPKLARGKSLIGSVAAFITGIIACYIFYGIIAVKFPQYNIDFEYNPDTNLLNLHTLALLSGFIAAISEGIDVANLDDNLTIPLFSGIFLSSVIKLGKTN